MITYKIRKRGCLVKFNLTSTQQNFYNKNFDFDKTLWNFGAIQIFH